MAGSCSASVFSVTCEKCNHILEKLSVLTTLEHRRTLEDVLEDYHPGFKACMEYQISVQCAVSPDGPWFDVDSNILLSWRGNLAIWCEINTC